MSPACHQRFFSRLRSYALPASAVARPHADDEQQLESLSPIVTTSKVERNYASALCSMFAIALLVVSLSDYRWFWLNGGLCNSKFLGLNMFFTVGKLFIISMPVAWNSSAPLNDIYQFKPNANTELTGCVDTRSILILRLIITFICLAIFSSCIGFFLDVLGPTRFGAKFMRRHALWHILSVFLCTSVLAFCYWASEIIYSIQERNRSKMGKKVDVQFDIAYYLLVLANSLSLLSIMVTLMKRYPSVDDEDFDRLLTDCSRRDPSLFIERALPASNGTHDNDPPPDYSA